MYLSKNIVSAIALFSISASALDVPSVNVPRANLKARSDVDTCKAILIALNASAFCSSFVPIKDVTQTSTVTGSSTSVTAPCANAAKAKKKRQLSTTPRLPSTTPAAPSTTPKISTTSAAPSTTPRAPSTTPAAPSTTPKISTTSSRTTTASPTSKCSIKGLPSGLEVFTCEVIDDACLAFVKPKTVTKTASVPGTTKTVTPTCPATTTRSRAPSTTLSTTRSTTLSTTTTSSSAPASSTCPSQAEDYCNSNHCVCGVQKSNNRAYCYDQYRCSPTAATSCQSDADCTAQEGAGFVCVFEKLGLCYDTTVCANSNGCPNSIPGQKKRQLEQVFEKTREVSMSRRRQ